MSSFEPKSEQEIDAMMVWPAGEYDFEVEDATWGESKSSGKPMITLKLKVFDEQGRWQYVTDWLVASSEALPLRKLRHYCAATGSMDAYESGDLNNFMGQGAAGRLNLVIEKRDDYPEKNKVADYVDPGKGATATKPELQGVPASQTKRAMQATADDSDPEIPF